MYLIVLINDPCSVLENHNLEKDDNGIQVITNQYKVCISYLLVSQNIQHSKKDYHTIRLVVIAGWTLRKLNA